MGALGGNIAREATEVYKTSVIEPRQETIQTLINRYIIWGMFEAYDWEFEFSPIDTSDESHDIEIAVKLFEKAAMTPNDLIRNFGVRFGVTESDHPAMNLHYLNGVPIDGNPDTNVIDETLKSVKSLQNKLLAIAVKGEVGDDEDKQ